jgi:hypothetical protein
VELAVVNPAVTGCREGGMAELSRALNVGSIVVSSPWRGGGRRLGAA